MRLIFTVLVCLMTVTPALAASDTGASDTASLLATVKHWKSSFNKGDIKAVIAACASDAVVIDEVAPFSWRGPDACSHWADAVGASFDQDKVTQVVMTMGKPWRATVDGNHGYFVAPAKLNYLIASKPGTETGSVITMTLVKEGADWRFSGIAWSGHN
jgi:ketosteroid isomerase-like protein